jgi:hypothetical protein
LYVRVGLAVNQVKDKCRGLIIVDSEGMSGTAHFAHKSMVDWLVGGEKGTANSTDGVGGDNSDLVNAISGGSPHLHVSSSVGHDNLATECCTVIKNVIDSTSMEPETRSKAVVFPGAVVEYALVSVLWHLTSTRRPLEAFALCFELPYLILRLAVDKGVSTLLSDLALLKGGLKVLAKKLNAAEKLRNQVRESAGGDDGVGVGAGEDGPSDAAASVLVPTNFDPLMAEEQLDFLGELHVACLSVEIKVALLWLTLVRV